MSTRAFLPPAIERAFNARYDTTKSFEEQAARFLHPNQNFDLSPQGS